MSGLNRKQASLIVFTVLWIAGAPAVASAEGALNESGKHQYLVIVTHDAADHLHLLDDWARDHKRLLAKAKWGCSGGVHTGWVIVEATSQEAALALIPASSRGDAKAIRVEAMDSPDRLKSIHRQLEQMYSLQKIE